MDLDVRLARHREMRAYLAGLAARARRAADKQTCPLCEPAARGAPARPYEEITRGTGAAGFRVI